MEKVDNINFRNRQTLLSDFFESGLNKINSQIFQKEKQNISKILSDYDTTADEKLKNLGLALKNPQYATEILKEDGISKHRNFEGEIQGFVENIKKTVFSLTSNHINSIFKPENNFLEEKEVKQEIFKEKPMTQVRMKKTGRVDDFEDDKRSISTTVSQNVKINEMTLTEENKYTTIEDDFMEKESGFMEKNDKPSKEYSINVFGANNEDNQKNNEKGKRGRKKKEKASEKVEEKSVEPPKKQRNASNQEKSQKGKKEKEEEKNVKVEERKNMDVKSFFNDYLNPKKRKEESNIPKPEKMEKKEEKIVMNAQTFLGALIDKKDGSFRKQRVFANSPLGSKSKDKKSGNFKDLF